MSGTRWLALLLGLWIAVSAFLGFGGEGYLWSDLLSGLVVVGTGAALMRESAWEGWTAAILGVWMVIAAFIPTLHASSGIYWNNVLVGGVIALVGVIPTGHYAQPHPAT